MDFKIYSSIKAIKRDWERVFAASSDLTPYQSYAWNRNMADCYRSNIHTFTSFSLRFVVGSKEGRPALIAPLAVPKGRAKTSSYIQFLEEYSKTGALNMVYDDSVTTEDFSQLLDELSRKWHGSTLKLYEVANTSRFEQFLASDPRAKKISDRICVRSGIPATEEGVYELLSKSVRQTLRTTAHRLENDGVSHGIEIYDSGYDFSEQERQFLAELYKKRLAEWKEHVPPQQSAASPLKKLFHLLFPSNDAFYAFAKNPDFVYAKYLMEGKIVAYLFAVKSEKGYFIVPTLIHDSDYNKYSPGLLLIHQFLREEMRRGGISCFDLSRGNEPYKTRYTPLPEPYKNNDYQINL